jgi:beta-glucanase (GH16 family)
MKFLKAISAAIALMLCTPAMSATLDRSILNPTPTFAAEFNAPNGTPLDTLSTKNPKGVWKTDYYFGNQREKASRPLTMTEQFSSRALTGEQQVYVDTEYCGQNVFYQGNGNLSINVIRATDYVKKTCGQGSRNFISGLLTTQRSFTQTYGYWEWRAVMPKADGTWAAFWLLPVEKTATNGGRLPEIDVLEHYAGPHKTIQVMKGVPLNRTNVDNITVHVGVTGNETALSPKPQPTVPTATTNFNTYGVLWTPTELVFYINNVEVYRTPFAYDKPMYLLMNVAVSDITAGDPAKGVYPAAMTVDYVRVYPLK